MRILPLMCSTCPPLSPCLCGMLTFILDFSSVPVRSVRRNFSAVLNRRRRMQFADKTTLGQSAVLGILYVSFPQALSALFLRVFAQSDRIYTRSVPTLQSSEMCPFPSQQHPTLHTSMVCCCCEPSRGTTSMRCARPATDGQVRGLCGESYSRRALPYHERRMACGRPHRRRIHRLPRVI